MNLRYVVGMIFFILIAVFFIMTALMTHPFGDPNFSADENEVNPTSMDDHIIEKTQNETGANNAVTAVVFDYRGFDTLGEATVLFTAVAGVVLAFRRLHK